MSTFTVIGLLLVLSGSAFIYLASPNQRWLAAPLTGRPGRALGLLLIGWLCLTRDMQILAATFVLVTFLMLAFVLLPYLGALRSIGRER